MKSDLQRKLVLPRAGSQSIADDGTISGGVVLVQDEDKKLTNAKNYLEDAEGNQGLVGLILSNSSKSGIGIEAGKETLDKDRYGSNDENHDDLGLAQYNSQDEQIKTITRTKDNLKP